MGKHWLFKNSESLLNLQFNTIISYLKSSSNDILEREKEIELNYLAWKKERGKNFDAEVAYSLFESNLYDHVRFSELLNSSTLVTVYSVFESDYYGICNRLKLLLRSQIDVNDLKCPSNIEQCRNYVKKVGNVDLTRLNEQWARIRKYQFLRNKIVHNNSRIADVKQDMLSFIHNEEGVEYAEKSKTVKITSIKFLLVFIELAKIYLVGVNEEIIRQT